MKKSEALQIKINYEKSTALYEMIKKYRDVTEDDSNLHTCRGLLDKRETWLLDQIEKIVGINKL